jgi:hypothetical protein
VRSRWRALVAPAVLSVVACASVAVSAPRAEAFVHNWSCSRVSADPCFDDSGQTFVAWVWVSAHTGATSDNICAKGRDHNGNPVPPQACQSNSHDVAVCFSDPVVETHAYVYWSGAGSTRQIDGKANNLSC